MNATNNFNDRKPSQTFTSLAPLDRMELEAIETTNRLMALPAFIITFSVTALLSLTIYHVQLTEQQHAAVNTLTTLSTLVMMGGFALLLKSSHRTLLAYSVVCAAVLGIVAPMGW